MIDVIVIGKGPAGISASLYIKRAGFEVIVIGKDNGALQKSDSIDNFYGFPDGIKGNDLIENGINQANKLGINVITDEVLEIEYDDGFIVNTQKSKYETKAIIMATGTNRKSPNIKGVKEFEGKGISYCAVCDGFFYKGKDVAVLGSGDYAISESMKLLPLVNSVTLLTNGKDSREFRAENLEVNQKEIREFRGENTIKEIHFKDNSSKEISGVFIAEGTASSVDFARKLGAKIEDNKIVVSKDMRN